MRSYRHQTPPPTPSSQLLPTCSNTMRSDCLQAPPQLPLPSSSRRARKRCVLIATRPTPNTLFPAIPDVLKHKTFSLPPYGPRIPTCLDASLPQERTSGDVDDHVLDLGVEIESVGTKLPAPPALLEPAPGRGRVDHVVAVDEHCARLQCMRHPMRTLYIVRPHAGDESVNRVVRLRDQVLLALERDGCQDRSKDLLLRDPHRAVDVGEHGGLHEVAGAETVHALATGHEPRALFVADIDVAENAVQLRLRNERAHLSHGIDAGADVQILDCLGQLVDHVVVDLLLDEQSRSGRADLALVEKDAEKRT